jgi:hypothetical protein
MAGLGGDLVFIGIQPMLRSHVVLKDHLVHGLVGAPGAREVAFLLTLAGVVAGPYMLSHDPFAARDVWAKLALLGVGSFSMHIALVRRQGLVIGQLFFAIEALRPTRESQGVIPTPLLPISRTPAPWL